MKYIDEYRDPVKVKKLVELIKEYDQREYTFMEVCGGHTMAIHRFGIPDLLPENIQLISGPGCPVCVTSKNFIDKAIFLAQDRDNIITTFGDLIRVPGSDSSLEKEKAEGKNIKVVNSALEALEMARNNKDKNIFFLGIGFETTAPGVGVVMQIAANEKIENMYLLSAHKIMPPAMQAIASDDIQLDGFICPGHVSAITGSSMYRFLPDQHQLACVIAGFEPTDILQSIYMLVQQVDGQKQDVGIQYKRAVLPEGNQIALAVMNNVFEPFDDWWRGFGIIPGSGLKLKAAYKKFDAEEKFEIKVKEPEEDKGCICGDILRGMKKPVDCKLFAKACLPESPIGACMVSNEGACHAYYKYHNYE